MVETDGQVHVSPGRKLPKVLGVLWRDIGVVKVAANRKSSSDVGTVDPRAICVPDARSDHINQRVIWFDLNAGGLGGGGTLAQLRGSAPHSVRSCCDG